MDDKPRPLSKVPSKQESPSKAASQQESPSKVPSEPGPPPKVTSEPGPPPKVPSEPGSPPKAPSEPGSPLKVPSEPGSSLKVPSEPGSPLKVPSEPGSPLKVPSEPGSPLKVPSEPGSPLKVPSEPGSPFKVPSKPASPSKAPSKQGSLAKEQNVDERKNEENKPEDVPLIVYVPVGSPPTSAPSSPTVVASTSAMSSVSEDEEYIRGGVSLPPNITVEKASLPAQVKELKEKYETERRAAEQCDDVEPRCCGSRCPDFKIAGVGCVCMLAGMCCIATKTAASVHPNAVQQFRPDIAALSLSGFLGLLGVCILVYAVARRALNSPQLYGDSADEVESPEVQNEISAENLEGHDSDTAEEP